MGTLVVIHSTSHEDLCCSRCPRLHLGLGLCRWLRLHRLRRTGQFRVCQRIHPQHQKEGEKKEGEEGEKKEGEEGEKKEGEEGEKKEGEEKEKKEGEEEEKKEGEEGEEKKEGEDKDGEK